VLADHPVEHRRFLERREVLALEVLDDRDLESGVVVDLLDEGRDRRDAGLARRSPAALAGDQLVAVVTERPDEDRLEDAVLGDRGGELTQRVLVEHRPRLARVRFDPIDRKHLHASGAAGVLR